MIKAVAALFLTVTLAIPFAGPAKSASLVISESTLQKLLDSKFPGGKIPIGQQDDCNNPYIETVVLIANQIRPY
jgi:hypothetical protein